MTELCYVHRVSQIYRGQFGEPRSISKFAMKNILASEMYLIVNFVCEYSLINILKLIIAEHTEVRI